MSKCPEGSVQNLTAWPLLLLFLVDVSLLAVTLGSRAMWKRQKKGGKSIMKRRGTIIQNIGRNRAYSKLQEDKEANAPPQIQMVSRIDRVESGFGFDAVLQHEYDTSISPLTRARTMKSKPTDLDRFILSLGKCLEDEDGDGKFGLSFEFNNLSFHPKKAPMPVISEVTGFIDSGSLWGVMGASGAGKCKLIRIPNYVKH